jgi:hypothetical protein
MNFPAILFGADPAGPHHILRAPPLPIEGLLCTKIAEEPVNSNVSS